MYRPLTDKHQIHNDNEHKSPVTHNQSRADNNASPAKIPLYLQRSMGLSDTTNIIQKQAEEEEEETLQPKAESSVVQKKLTVSQPDDPYEKEADRVADQVMTMPDATVQRQPLEEEEEELQTKANPQSLYRQQEDEEEEEEVQAKLSSQTLYRQAENDEEDEEGEEEEVQAKPISAQITPLQKSVTQRQPEEEEEELQAKSERPNKRHAPTAVASHVKSLDSGGQALPTLARHFFETRFGQDFSRVRIHADAGSAQTAKSIQAKAYTSGHNIVFGSGYYAPESTEGRRLLAHELTHVVQQTGKVSRKLMPQIQRRVMMYVPPASSSAYSSWRAMPRTQRQRLVRQRFSNRAERALAYRVIEDLASAGDSFRFTDEAELYTELHKRVLTSRIMQATQTTVRGRRGFGYPFTVPSLYWGPRVNYAARDYWLPATPDNYSLRNDPVRRRQLRRLPRNRRYTVFGDQGSSYRFWLSTTGRADPYQAIVNLFDRQPAHKRSLIHCDYLVSLVHFRAFAETIGRAEFNRRATAFMSGGRHIILRYNLFSDLEVPFGMRTSAQPLGSLQRVRPSSEADLVIGDHVYFFNHRAYDLINRNIGNAWRLENAVLIDRPGRQNIYLGHGSGRKTAAQMRSKLAQEYNDVVNIALGVIRRTRAGSAASRAAARTEMGRRFPNIRLVGNRWRVQGYLSLFGMRSGSSRPYYDVPLRRIHASEVVGLKDPTNPLLMNPVRRPVESR